MCVCVCVCVCVWFYYMWRVAEACVFNILNVVSSQHIKRGVVTLSLLDYIDTVL